MLRRIADALAADGWCEMPAYVALADAAALRDEAAARLGAGRFRPARVGRADGVARVPHLRGDHILWLEPDDASTAVRAALSALDALRRVLNEELFLGLVELEAHLAVYPPGSGYGMHVDRFSDDDARVVSVVLYLNDGWRPEDGGCLRLHLGDAGSTTTRDIPPRAGTLAVFLAERFPHEVLPARRERYSLTGWFLRRR